MARKKPVAEEEQAAPAEPVEAELVAEPQSAPVVKSAAEHDLLLAEIREVRADLNAVVGLLGAQLGGQFLAQAQKILEG